MGEFANGRVLSATAWVTAVVIALLNAWLLTIAVRSWLA
jgi:Mn2+/Fe2+ NRAMP family transporter